MLKMDITYPDFDNNTRTQTCYFNLNEYDIAKLDTKYPEGLQVYINKMLDTGDRKAAFEFVTDIIVASYGVKSEDGLSLVKDPKAVDNFVYTALFAAIFKKVTVNEQALNDFFLNVVPASVKTATENKMAAIEG